MPFFPFVLSSHEDDSADTGRAPHVGGDAVVGGDVPSAGPKLSVELKFKLGPPDANPRPTMFENDRPSIPRASRVARGISDEAERDGNARVSTSPQRRAQALLPEGGDEGANEGVVRVVCDCESMTDET